MNAEAREADAAQRLWIELVRAVVEKIGVEADLARHSVDDLVDAHGPGVVQAHVEELELEGQPRAAPHRARRIEANVAILVVGQLAQWARDLALRRLVRLRRDRRRAPRDVLEAEGVGVRGRERNERRNGELQQRYSRRATEAGNIGAHGPFPVALRGSLKCRGARSLRQRLDGLFTCRCKPASARHAGDHSIR